MNFSALANIPAFPPVAAKLLRVASSEDAGASDLVYLLRADPALSAEIIRCANSPLFHFTSDIRTIEQAVPLLGVRKIRALALAAIGRTYVRAVLVIDELRVLWRYNMACALLSEMLARYCGVAEDAAYSAALLHDIGRLGLMVAFPSEYSSLLRTASQKLEAGEEFDMIEYERTLFGIDRFSAGAWLARRWNLPEEFCAAAGPHNRQESGEELDLVGVIYAGCRLANGIGLGLIRNGNTDSYHDVIESLPPNVGSRFPAQAEDLRAQVEEEIDALELDNHSGHLASEPEMLSLLELEQGVSDGEAIPETGADGKRRTIWPVILTAAAVFAVVLVALRFIG